MNYNDVSVTPRRHHALVAERWNPWRALRSRPQTTFARAPLPAAVGGGVCASWPDGDAVIVVDSGLLRRERAVVLAHELVHLERGIDGVPGLREETAVDREVARRLVPLDELEEWVVRRTASEIPTTPFDVAEHWDTTEGLAELAMLLLKGGSS